MPCTDPRVNPHYGEDAVDQLVGLCQERYVLQERLNKLTRIACTMGKLLVGEGDMPMVEEQQEAHRWYTEHALADQKRKALEEEDV